MTKNSLNEFKAAIVNVINTHSRENNSDTPDFILGQFLMQCLEAFEQAINQRDEWYERDDQWYKRDDQ